MREYYQSTINAVNNNNNNNNSWSGLKGIVDSKLEPKGKKLHDHLRLIEAEMIDGIIHNNKKKINSVEIEKRLLTYSSCSNKVKRDMYNRADN